MTLKCTANRRKGLCRKWEATETRKGNGAKGREADRELRRREGFGKERVMGMSALQATGERGTRPLALGRGPAQGGTQGAGRSLGLGPERMEARGGDQRGLQAQ